MPDRVKVSEIVEIDDPVRRISGGALNFREKALRGGLGGCERLFDLVHSGVIVGRNRLNARLACADELDELPRRVRGRGALGVGWIIGVQSPTPQK